MEKHTSILLPVQSSTIKRSTPTINKDDLSRVENCTLELNALLSSLESHDSDNSSSVQSSSSDEKVKKYKRKLSMYQAMINNMPKQQPESSRKKKAENFTNGISTRQMLLGNSINIIKNSFQRSMDEAKTQGYVYGIVLEDDSVISGSSPSLCKWWEEMVRFEQSGTAAVQQYYMNKDIDLKMDTDTPRQSYDILLDITDGILASVLSALMSHCNPPQRKFPLEKKVSPPWWPTGNESWWDQITIEKDQGTPPYKKPHDLRKMWKAAVVIAIIKHMAPDFDKLAHLVKQSKNLQTKMSLKELQAWHQVLTQEAKMYSREHSGMPLSSFPPNNSKFRGLHNEVNSFQPHSLPPQQEPILPTLQEQQQHQVAPLLTFQTEQRFLSYTCDHQMCLHYNSEFGFPTMELWNQHLQSCGFRTLTDQFGTLVEHLPFPASAMYEETPYSSSQQIVLPTMELQPPAPSHQEAPPTLPINNAGVSCYPSNPNNIEQMGSLQSVILGSGFCNGELSSHNAGPFM